MLEISANGLQQGGVAGGHKTLAREIFGWLLLSSLIATSLFALLHLLLVILLPFGKPDHDEVDELDNSAHTSSDSNAGANHNGAIDNDTSARNFGSIPCRKIILISDLSFIISILGLVLTLIFYAILNILA